MLLFVPSIATNSTPVAAPVLEPVSGGLITMSVIDTGTSQRTDHDLGKRATSSFFRPIWGTEMLGHDCELLSMSCGHLPPPMDVFGPVDDLTDSLVPLPMSHTEFVVDVLIVIERDVGSSTVSVSVSGSVLKARIRSSMIGSHVPAPEPTPNSHWTVRRFGPPNHVCNLVHSVRGLGVERIEEDGGRVFVPALSCTAATLLEVSV